MSKKPTNYQWNETMLETEQNKAEWIGQGLYLHEVFFLILLKYTLHEIYHLTLFEYTIR